MKILSIVGTRPNFIKIAPLIWEFKKHKIGNFLVHTGQHYDAEMSRFFFKDLEMPKPDINLEVGSGSYGAQIGNIMIKLEKILVNENPNLVVVVGDVNSTLAGALISKQLGIRVAHVESGLRSFDMSMPEEINRMLTDRISDYLFTTEKSGNENLLKEGANKENIFFVGNVMIDTLLKHKEKAKKSDVLQRNSLKEKDYCLLTLHRPSNVDNKEDFENIISVLESIQEKIRIIFPIHPRTQKNLELFNLNDKLIKLRNLIIINPLSYLDFLCLMNNSKLVLTDSGGIQEETTVLGIPCITLRDNTERPVTVEHGTNLLVSTDAEKVIGKVNELIEGKVQLHNKIPELWDGKAAERIVKILLEKNLRDL